LKIPFWQSGNATNAMKWSSYRTTGMRFRRLMWDYVGIVRTEQAAATRAKAHRQLAGGNPRLLLEFHRVGDLLELRNIATVAELIVNCALQRPKAAAELQSGFSRHESRLGAT